MLVVCGFWCFGVEVVLFGVAVDWLVWLLLVVLLLYWLIGLLGVLLIVLLIVY